jgi:AcrR family transcriptional regulator
MSDACPARRVRADAERSTARILEAAEAVLAEDAGASLGQIADTAGLARATVHRRFSSRTALLDALAQQLNERYRRALAEVRVESTPPLIALHRLTEIVFEVKLSHRFAVQLPAAVTPEILAGLDLLFTCLRDAGAITAGDPTWCRQVYLGLMHVVHELPDDSPMLVHRGDVTAARVDLHVRTVLAALGGTRDASGPLAR